MYYKFFKEILSKKRKSDEHETLALGDDCSVMVPTKRKDPNSFSIAYLINNVSIDRALWNLGSSVSLMPDLIFKKHGIGELRSTNNLLQLADYYIKYSLGIL